MNHKSKITAAAVIFLILAASSYLLYFEEQGNFHAITDGEAYRSAQLDRDELEYYIRERNIRSIINLRGEHVDEPWYAEELEVSSEHKINHYNIALSSTREPSDRDIKDLIEIFLKAPRPVLIHCQAGADRSGLAAAIWKVVIDKEPKSSAKGQLSILFGHLPIGRTTAMDHFFERWKPEG